jgi:hypothetical protein
MLLMALRKYVFLRKLQRGCLEEPALVKAGTHRADPAILQSFTRSFAGVPK